MTQSLTECYDDRIAGVLSCYDRIVVSGTLPVSGGENPRIDGDVAGCGASSFCGEGAVVLTAVKDARRGVAVAFGHP